MSLCSCGRFTFPSSSSLEEWDELHLKIFGCCICDDKYCCIKTLNCPCDLVGCGLGLKEVKVCIGARPEFRIIEKLLIDLREELEDKGIYLRDSLIDHQRGLLVELLREIRELNRGMRELIDLQSNKHILPM